MGELFGAGGCAENLPFLVSNLPLGGNFLCSNESPLVLDIEAFCGCRTGVVKVDDEEVTLMCDGGSAGRFAGCGCSSSSLVLGKS